MSEQTITDESKELDKFTKFLAIKSAQIIVQSRLGNKVRTQCKPYSLSNKDWFYLAIDEMPDVQEQTKAAFEKAPPDALPFPFCVEIVLKLKDKEEDEEGPTMLLETWCVGVDPTQRDPSVRVAYTIYNKMGILLKSLVSVTRVIPAYKLSRRQNQGQGSSYTVRHNIYVGEPQYHLLGEGYKQARIGQLGTPGGTIHITCYYRTKMAISPQPSKETSIMLKSDHFRPEYSPKLTRSHISDEKTGSLSETVKVGAFVESVSLKEQLEASENENDVPFSNLLKPATPLTGLKKRMETNNPLPPCCNPQTSPPPPLSNEDSDNGNISPRSNEDFIMVDLKTPFAGSNANTELGVFYRECQCAPQLEGFTTEDTLSEQVGDLTSQLVFYETKMIEYDNVITELCASDNNN